MKRLTVILILGLFCFSCSNEKLSNDRPFDSSSWKDSNKRVKGQMVKDLEKSKILISKTKNDTKEVLGKPDFEGENLWIYEVNMGES